MTVGITDEMTHQHSELAIDGDKCSVRESRRLDCSDEAVDDATINIGYNYNNRQKKET